jgi:hypothetical protein
MHYLLVDTRQRPLGTMNSDKVYSVGDTLQNHDAQGYTVIGLNGFKQLAETQSLTVIPLKAAIAS